MDSTSAVYPLLTIADDGQSPLLVFRRGSVPVLVLDEAESRPVMVMEGEGFALRQFTDRLCNTFPNTGNHLRLRDVTAWVSQAMSLKNPDGQAAWVECFGGTEALLSAGADLNNFRRRWPHTRFCHYNDSASEEVRSYELPSEMEALHQALEPVYTSLRPGDRVSLRCAVGQDRPERESFLEEFRQRLAHCGAVAEHAAAVCAFKQGLSWREEDFGTRAAALGDGSRVVVRFNPHQRPSVR